MNNCCWYKIILTVLVYNLKKLMNTFAMRKKRLLYFSAEGIFCEVLIPLFYSDSSVIL